MGANHWKKAQLADLIDIIHGFAFKGDYFREEPPGDVLLTPGNFAIGGGFKGDKLKYYDGPVPEDYVLDEDDLLVTMTDLSKASDTLGYPSLVPKASPNSRFLHNQRLGKVSVNPDAPLKKEFLYYLLCSRAYRHEVLASATGTTVKHTSPGRIKAFRFALPPLDEQKEIAHILGTLDDKIELNQQMNRTLEGIARALFKSWFIDFDPVRAKLDGRQPSGMDAETAALFPDAFEDGGAIGPIPKGWKQCNLGDFLNLKRGYDLPKRLREEGNVPIISSSGFSGYHSTPKVKAPGVATGRYGTVGQVFFIEEDFWPLNTTLYVQDFKGNNPKIAYYILEQIDFNVYADKAAVPGVNRNHVHQEKIVAPPRQIQERFFKLLEPTWQQQTVNEQETETLRDLRDVLLPKLLSGKIRVKEAEQAIELTTV